jgi:hypothetical protein
VAIKESGSLMASSLREVGKGNRVLAMMNIKVQEMSFRCIKPLPENKA